MSTARAGWCCSDNSPHRPTVDRSLALRTVPFAPTPMPPFCPSRPIFFSVTLPNAVSSPTLFVCVPTAVIETLKDLCVCITVLVGGRRAGASSYHSMYSFLPSCVTTTSSAHGVPATCTLCLLSCPTFFHWHTCTLSARARQTYHPLVCSLSVSPSTERSGLRLSLALSAAQ